MAALDLYGISKRYSTSGGPVAALVNLSLSIPTGGVYGLLGPNGAGKSTLLRVITGLARADAGTVRIFDEAASVSSRRRLGAFIESPTFYPYLTAAEVLNVLGRTSGVSPPVPELLGKVGLSEAAHRPVAGLSLGMKQRLAIAAALVGKPQILILDEPTNGLDPLGILQVRGFIRDLADREGLTVLMSSHMLDEVERICDRVAILRAGSVAAEGKVRDLIAGDQRLWLDATPAQAVLDRLGSMGSYQDGGVAAQIQRSEAPALLAALAADGVKIFEARWLRRNLESVFLAETEGP